MIIKKNIDYKYYLTNINIKISLNKYINIINQVHK